MGTGLGAEIGAAVFMELNGKTYKPIHDAQGNVVCLLDGEKSAAEYSYSAFGELTNKSISYLSPWLFSSKRYDQETGFIYFGRRYYSPEIGRWITPDPIGHEGGPNLYAYVFNSPHLSIDLYGLMSHSLGGQAIERIARGDYERSVRDRGESRSFSNRLHGGLRAAAGLSEILASAGTVWFSAGSLSVVGAGLALHGADQFTAGMRSVFTGNYVDTAIAQSLQMAGLSPSSSRFVDSGVGIVLTAGGAHLAYKSGSYVLRVCTAESSLASVSAQVSKTSPTIAARSATPIGTTVQNYTKNNCRKNLERFTGISPPGDTVHAHHVFPQRFKDQFAARGINIHEPQYLTWWEKNSHLKASKSYNEEWNTFFYANKEATLDQILDVGKKLC